MAKLRISNDNALWTVGFKSSDIWHIICSKNLIIMDLFMYVFLHWWEIVTWSATS